MYQRFGKEKHTSPDLYRLKLAPSNKQIDCARANSQLPGRLFAVDQQRIAPSGSSGCFHSGGF